MPCPAYRDAEAKPEAKWMGERPSADFTDRRCVRSEIGAKPAMAQNLLNVLPNTRKGRPMKKILAAVAATLAFSGAARPPKRA